MCNPKFFVIEWASFSTTDFPENKYAKDGETVKIIMADVNDARPVEDIIRSHGQYEELFEQCNLEIEAMYNPLGKPEEQFAWKSEFKIAPWVIYVLKKRL